MFWSRPPLCCVVAYQRGGPVTPLMAGQTLSHLPPCSTCPSAPWPDLVPSLLVSPHPTTLRELERFPSTQYQPRWTTFNAAPRRTHWTVRTPLSRSLGFKISGKRFEVHWLGPARVASRVCNLILKRWIDILAPQWCRRSTFEAATPQVARDVIAIGVLLVNWPLCAELAAVGIRGSANAAAGPGRLPS